MLCDKYFELLLNFFLFRIEWQFRGSGHLHGLLWFKDAPNDLEFPLTDEQIEIIRLYFDHLSVAINPELVEGLGHLREERESDQIHPCRKRFTEVSEEDRLSDINKLVNKFQQHTKCGSYCIRFSKEHPKGYCRFKFPKPLNEKSEVKFDNKGHLEFTPQRNDGQMGRFNAFVTQVSSL